MHQPLLSGAQLEQQEELKESWFMGVRLLGWKGFTCFGKEASTGFFIGFLLAHEMFCQKEDSSSRRGGSQMEYGARLAADL